MQTIKLLIIEDSSADADLIRDFLKESSSAIFSITHVSRFNEAVEMLQKDFFDAILMDMTLPDAQGLSMMERFKEYTYGVPIIILTGTFDDNALAIEALHRGASDYLVKEGIEERAISRSIRYAIERKKGEVELQRAMDELARSNTDLEQFASMVSHDLKAPLRNIGGFVRLLQRDYQGKMDKTADEYISYTVEGIDKLNNLIDDLLHYARVGRSEESMAPIHCEVVFNEAVGNLKAAIHETGATITHDLLPTLMGRQSEMVQLFQNLIGNAIKYYDKKPPVVHIASEQTGKEWRITVSDNGIGMDPKYIDQIFLPFKRLHTYQAYPGTGIGLAICRKIVEGYGGRIWVESVLGQGSTFYFTLSAQEQKG